jgi:hypothetical protein
MFFLSLTQYGMNHFQTPKAELAHKPFYCVFYTIEYWYYCSVLVEANCDKIRNGERRNKPYTWNPLS